MYLKNNLNAPKIQSLVEIQIVFKISMAIICTSSPSTTQRYQGQWL
jgi:hypothetical protein